MAWKTLAWWLKYFLSVHRYWCSPRLKKKKKLYQSNKKTVMIYIFHLFLWYWKSSKADVLYQTSVPRPLPLRHNPLLQGAFSHLNFIRDLEIESSLTVCKYCILWEKNIYSSLRQASTASASSPFTVPGSHFTSCLSTAGAINALPQRTVWTTGNYFSRKEPGKALSSAL